MKILKLLNSNYLSIILIVIFTFVAKAEEEPIDIWNVDNGNVEKTQTDINQNNNNQKRKQV